MALNLAPLLSRLSISTKGLRVEPLYPNWAQKRFLKIVEDQYNAGKPVRVICLKARQLGMCLAPETRVLTADLRWVPIDDLAPGDRLVSVDENFPGGRGAGRKMRPAVVEARWDVYEPAYRLLMDNGETLVATGQHHFLSKDRGTNTRWVPVKNLLPGESLRYVTQPWGPASYEDGWFGGMLDGEGSLSLPSRPGANLAVCQQFGDVFQRAEEYLKERGYSFRVEVDDRPPGDTSKFGSTPVAKLVVSRMNELFRLIGQTRPSRFVNRPWWEDRDLPGKKSGVAWSRIISIEPLGEQRMVDLQTSTKTFIAEGFVSHNSTATEAILFWWSFLHPGANSLVVAHDVMASRELFEKTRMYWETFPFNNLFTVRSYAANRISWEETRSTIKIATAKNVRSARGQTLHAVHLSEVAFWDQPEDLMLGLSQAIPRTHGTIVVLESTANGVGNWFHETWQKAEMGESDYVPLFLPWWEHPEYRASYIGHNPELQSAMDAKETWLHKKLGVDEDRLAWRRLIMRDECNGDPEKFSQEFPATAEEAFIQSGTNVFPLDNLKNIYSPLEGQRGFLERVTSGIVFRPDRAGPVTIFRMPATDREWGMYFVAGDPTHTTTGDRACIQVINRRTYEQVAVWHGHLDPIAFAEELVKMGIFYNDATLTTEIESCGYATIGRLVEMDYPHLWHHRWADKIPGKLSETLGWSTSYKRKEWAIGHLLALINRADTTIHDKVTFEQMRNYVTLNVGGYGPASRGGYDDAVMAFAIACICSSTEGPLEFYVGEPTRPGGLKGPGGATLQLPILSPTGENYEAVG